MNRRQVLALAGTLAIAGTAGCSAVKRATGGGPEPPASIDSTWPLPEYDPGQTNYTPETSGPADPVSELWRVDGPGEPSALAVASGLVFAAGGDTVRALDARDGTTQWDASGPAATAVWGVVEDQLYIGADREVIALEATRGREVWRTSLPPVTDAVVTADGVYVLGHASETLSVVALGPEDGQQQWRVELSADGNFLGILASDGHVIVWATGDQGGWWVLDAATGDVAADRSGGTQAAIPHASREGVACLVDGFYGTVFASGHQDTAWRRELDAHNSGPPLPVAVGPERLYFHFDVGNKPGLYALDVTDGTQLWHADTGGSISAAVESERVRLVACGESLLVATANALRSLDAQDGTERWSVGTGGIDWFGAVDDLIYAIHDGDIVALREG